MHTPSRAARPAHALRFSSLALVAACLVLLGAGCATQPHAAGASFVVLRHAEKSGDHPRDPSLADAGRRRAEALAARLRDADVAAVYATQYRRTLQTAEPVARTHGLDVIRYDAGEPADTLARRLRAAHAAGTVVVVGHGNTAPQIASALCGCPVAPLSEADYGDLYRISPGRDGRPVFAHGRY